MNKVEEEKKQPTAFAVCVTELKLNSVDGVVRRTLFHQLKFFNIIQIACLFSVSSTLQLLWCACKQPERPKQIRSARLRIDLQTRREKTIEIMTAATLGSSTFRFRIFIHIELKDKIKFVRNERIVEKRNETCTRP